MQKSHKMELDVGARGPAVQVDGGEVEQGFALVDVWTVLEVVEPAGQVQIGLLVHRREGFLKRFKSCIGNTKLL